MDVVIVRPNILRLVGAFILGIAVQIFLIKRYETSKKVEDKRMARWWPAVYLLVIIVLFYIGAFF